MSIRIDEPVSAAARHWPIGAECLGDGVSFRVWAPRRRNVAVVLEQPSLQHLPLESEGGGYFHAFFPGIEAGARYRFQLDDDETQYPDPMSRYQPEGPHGPSEVVNPGAFSWTDLDWKGVSSTGQVIYEMHLGTFTAKGTWTAATERLPYLADLGVTLLEVMPVADFAGEFGWGYDGVNLFAPSRLYGTPDDFRRFVDRAHALGLGVILDVVYNHFGPDGNSLPQFSEDYVTERHPTDWGLGINFDGESSGPVREYFLTNVAYWIREFHLDGLRFDATQDIHDDSDDPILAAMTRTARTAADGRSIFLVAENEPQEARQLTPVDEGGYGMNAVWNDDFHHTALVALTGCNEAYFTDYLGTPQELISAFKWGYLYQGQWYAWQKKRRGTPTRHFTPSHFVTFLCNHDQIANLTFGRRTHQTAHPGLYRALTGLYLLGPGTPMLFQGQEFAASSPFCYFADHHGKLGEMVSHGRKQFLSQFPSVANDEVLSRVSDPGDPETFHRSKLDWSECETHAEMLEMHRDLLRLRRTEPVLSRMIREDRRDFDAAVLSDHAFLLRYFSEDGLDRLLMLNLARDTLLMPAPEPLLAEPAGCDWTVVWSSEEPRYGGTGTPPLWRDGVWFLPAFACLFLAPVPQETSCNR